MSHRSLLLLALILIAALSLRLYRLASPSFWLDEILTVQLSVGRGYAHLDFPQNQLIAHAPDLITLHGAPPPWRIWSSLDRDVHPPLFYIVLRIWREITGDSDLRLRMLSVVLSLAAIVALYFAVRVFHAEAPALWAAALMAVAGPQIEYAQEVRSYMLLLIALLCAAAAIGSIERSGPSVARAALLAGSILAAMLTHYAAFPVAGLMLVYVLIRLRGRVRRVAAGSVVLAGMFCVIAWGPFWLRQMRGIGERVEFTVQQPITPAQTLWRASSLPIRFFTESPVKPAWLALLGASLYVLPLLRLRARPDMLLWCMWLIGYVTVVTAHDLARQADVLQWIRYTLAASPPAFALVATLLSDRGGWSRHAVPAALCLACMAALPQAYTRHKADWRLLAEPLVAQGSPDDVMVVGSRDARDWQARTNWLCLRYYAPQPQMPVAFLSEPAPDVLRQMHGRDVWLYGGGQSMPLELLPGWQWTERQYVPHAGTLTRLRAAEKVEDASTP